MPPLHCGVAAFCSSTGIGMVCGSSTCAAHGTARPTRTRALTKYSLSMIFSWPFRATSGERVLTSGAITRDRTPPQDFSGVHVAGQGRLLELDSRPPDQLPEMSLGPAIDLGEVEPDEAAVFDLEAPFDQDVADGGARGTEGDEVVGIGCGCGPELGAAGGEHDEVGALAGLDRTDLVLEIEGAGAFAGGEAEGVEAGERAGA